MEFETLWSGKKRFWVRLSLGISLFCVVLFGALTFYFSHAKYRNTQSIPLASGTITYTRADFSALAFNVQQSENGPYQASETIPKGNYTLNETKTYCTVGNANTRYEGKTSLSSAGITISYENSSFTFSGIKQSPTKCYVFLDIVTKTTAEQALAKLGNYTIKTDTSFSGTSSDTAKVVYKLKDNDGDTYVFRGNPDNWVTFAGKTWRIIRVNGDGTLRLLYYCGDTTCTTSANAVEGKTYNSSYSNNTYVGFYYGATSGDYNTTHSNTTASTIAGELKTWYQSNLETTYKAYLSETTGWCNDRQVGTSRSGYTGNGTGTQATVYAPASRLTTDSWGSKTPFIPKLTCESRDLFTIPNSGNVGNKAMTLKTTSGNYVPVGLITADEAAIGGLLYSSPANKNSYVSAGSSSYWTLSPYTYNSSSGRANVFYVYSGGYLADNYVNNTTGVRPVINVNLDKVKSITGSGTSLSRFAIT